MDLELPKVVSIFSLPIVESHASGCRRRDHSLVAKCRLKLLSTCSCIISSILRFIGLFVLSDFLFIWLLVCLFFTSVASFLYLSFFFLVFSIRWQRQMFIRYSFYILYSLLFIFNIFSNTIFTL